MKAYKFIAGEPEDGTMITGVTYYIGYDTTIQRLVKFAQRHRELFELEQEAIPPESIKPIGYVAREE